MLSNFSGKCLRFSFILLNETCPQLSSFFFFNDTATTEIYTLSLHDALPIFLGHVPVHYAERADLHGVRLPGRDEQVVRLRVSGDVHVGPGRVCLGPTWTSPDTRRDRKSTRLNSSHDQISYAVFCLKKKKQNQ